MNKPTNSPVIPWPANPTCPKFETASGQGAAFREQSRSAPMFLAFKPPLAVTSLLTTSVDCRNSGCAARDSLLGGTFSAVRASLFGLTARLRWRHRANRRVYISREATLTHHGLSSRHVFGLTLAAADQLQSSSVPATQTELSVWVFLVLSAVAYFRALIVCGQARVSVCAEP